MKKMYFLSLVLLMSSVSNVFAPVLDILNTIESALDLKTNERFDALIVFNNFIQNLSELSFKQLNRLGINSNDNVEEITERLTLVFNDTYPELAEDSKKFAEPLIKNLATNFVNIKTKSNEVKVLISKAKGFINEQVAEVLQDYYDDQTPGGDNRYDYDYNRASAELRELKSTNKVAIKNKQDELKKAETLALQRGGLSQNDRKRIEEKTQSDLAAFKAKLQKTEKNLEIKINAISKQSDQARKRYQNLQEMGIYFKNGVAKIRDTDVLDSYVDAIANQLLVEKGISNTTDSNNFKKAIEVLRNTSVGEDGKLDTTIESRTTVLHAFDPVEPVKPVDQPVEPVDTVDTVV